MTERAETMKLAAEGLVFYLPPLIMAAGLLVPGWWAGSIFFFLLAVAFAFFFRDPLRQPPAEPGLVLSPADGQVLKIEPFDSQAEIAGPGQKISIFLSLLDVHFTRSPLGAEIVKVDYQPGKLPAYREEASSQNESNTLLLKTEVGQLILKQTVGVAARRIKCYVKPEIELRPVRKSG